MVGVLFVALCVFGMIAAVYPAPCKGIFQKAQSPIPMKSEQSFPMKSSGHHPDCHNFFANRVKIRNRAFCAACSGLLVGAIIALIGAAAYFFVGLNLGIDNVWFLAAGEIMMLLGIAQIRFAGYVKVVANMLFVVGSFLTIVVTDTIGKSVIVDLYALGLIALMLWLRISLSEWNNKRTCQACQRCLLRP